MTPIRFLRLNLKEENEWRGIISSEKVTFSTDIWKIFFSLISTFALTGLNIFLDISNLHFWLVRVRSCICRISCHIYTETNFTTKGVWGCWGISSSVLWELNTVELTLDSHLVTCLVLLDKSLWLWSEVLIISHKTQLQPWTLSWQYSHQS